VKSSRRPRTPLRLCALAVLSIGLLLAPGAAQATANGTVVAWGCVGIGGSGQCSVPSGLFGVAAIAATSNHNLALKSDGTVVAWGCGGIDFGQCSLPSGLSGVTAIAAHAVHSLALKSDGTVIAWGCAGASDDGQCSVPSDLSGVTAIAAGRFHSLALTGDGTVVAWGCGGFGNWGQCTVPTGLSGVTAIAAGHYYSLALKSNGTVVAWGCGILGLQGACNVPSDLSGVMRIAAGADHALALKVDGTVVAWGKSCQDVYTNFGQCNVPSGLSGVTAIAASLAHSLALKGDGTVVAFGCGTASGLSSDYGQCDVPGGLSGMAAIAAGNSHSLALVKASQTITFGALAGKTFGDPDFGVSASASSGLPVSFAASGNCTVSAASVHITGAGSCMVTGSQPGDSNYVAAPDVSQSFAVAKAGQSITFGPLANKTYGAPDFSVSATGSSGLAVSFAAIGNCTVSATTVHLTGAGSCTVTASQPGDANYNAAPDASHNFAIAPAPCTVPNVVGKRVASAKLMIGKRHCRTGMVGYAYSRKHKKGIVISQSRRPGRVLPARSKIHLIVSRGRRR
jgi:alpha-tubulin suppressor-like RCC1 family protein